MSLLDRLLSPKARARVVVRIRTAESANLLQNMVKTWGIPGRLRPLSGGHFDIEMEGRQSAIRSRVDELCRCPFLANNTLQIQWLPYTGRFSYMMICF
jgi:hypothetical protein